MSLVRAVKLRIEPHMPADLLSERPAALVRDAPRDGARGHPPRLQQQHRAVFDERRRHARRLPGTRLGRHDERAMPTDLRDDVLEVGIDGKR